MAADLWKSLDRRLRKSDIAGSIAWLEKMLAKEKTDRFKGLLGNGFTNSPKSILGAINKFVKACAKKFDVEAVYLEMNGFDVNPDLWFFDCFAYTEYETDPDDLEWLSDWQSPEWPNVPLKGLEKVQADFKWYQSNEMWKDKEIKQACGIAILLVMCKYASLIASALKSGALAKPVPLLATAHDFDIAARFEPE